MVVFISITYNQNIKRAVTQVINNYKSKQCLFVSDSFNFHTKFVIATPIWM